MYAQFTQDINRIVEQACGGPNIQNTHTQRVSRNESFHAAHNAEQTVARIEIEKASVLLEGIAAKEAADTATIDLKTARLRASIEALDRKKTSAAHDLASIRAGMVGAVLSDPIKAAELQRSAAMVLCRIEALQGQIDTEQHRQSQLEVHRREAHLQALKAQAVVHGELHTLLQGEIRRCLIGAQVRSRLLEDTNRKLLHTQTKINKLEEGLST